MKEVTTYTLKELTDVVEELRYAQGVLTGKQNELNAKRAAIKSFEDDEAKANYIVERIKARVKLIASNLEK